MIPAPDIDARFAEFDAANPDVWAAFERFTRQAIAAGRERYSADAILHRIRWHMAIETTRDGERKINDHFSSRYARKWGETYPELAGFFETRTLRSRPPEPGRYGIGAAE
jgi:hypothetical protein